ncbi:MAG: tetratricopeptide repeat protein [Promethearchaeota archaeon]
MVEQQNNYPIINDIITLLPDMLTNDVRQLMNKGIFNEEQVKEIVQLIKEFKQRKDITLEEKLKCQLGLASLYSRALILVDYEESINISEKVYQSAMKLGNFQIAIKSLYVMGSCFHFMSKFKKVFEVLERIEKLLNHLSILQKADYLSFKGWYCFFKGNFDNAIDYASQSLELRKEFANNNELSESYYQLISHFKSKGELNKALEFEEPALTLNNLQSGIEAQLLGQLGEVYANKGELDQSLIYYEKVLELEKETKAIHPNFARKFDFIVGSFRIGNFYRLKGDFDQALLYLGNFLKYAETIGHKYFTTQSLFWIIVLNLEKNSITEAQKYLKRLETVVENVESPLFSQTYRIAKALILKSSTRSINKGEAERILKKVAEEDVTYHEINTIALISLCDLLLAELGTSNDIGILEEINPYITKLLEHAENQQSYRWIAEIYLLKAKISQIKFNLDDARKFLTKAQKIANKHGLKLLAQKISQEHDKLLGELNTWQTFRETQASLSKRMNLISVDGVIERLLHKRTIIPPELDDEESIFLLIMGRDGISYFNHPFVENWNFDDIFSSFMSAFNSFSSEIFAKNIDRIRIDENIILITPVDSFLVCYVIKGQSFTALQKLNRFSDAIKWNTEISEALKKSVQTGEELDLTNPASLGIVVNEIFSR